MDGFFGFSRTYFQGQNCLLFVLGRGSGFLNIEEFCPLKIQLVGKKPEGYCNSLFGFPKNPVLCPKNGIIPTFLFQGWDWNPIGPIQSGGVWILRVYSVFVGSVSFCFQAAFTATQRLLSGGLICAGGDGWMLEGGMGDVDDVDIFCCGCLHEGKMNIYRWNVAVMFC